MSSLRWPACVAISLTIATESISAQVPKPPVQLCADEKCEPSDFHPSGYSLIFSDEFSGTQLDRSLWCSRFVYAGGAAPQIKDPECQKSGDGSLDVLNDEQQRYVDLNTRNEKMHVVHSGVLSLRATKTRSDSAAPYEAAMIRSKRLFAPSASKSYYITSRVDIPNVRGTWGAFWLNADRLADGTTHWPPEIDIFEAPLNEVEDTANMLHMGAQIRGKQTQSGQHELTFAANDLDQKWHNLKSTSSLRDTWVEAGVLWTRDSVCYYFDGAKTMCENYKWVYNDGSAAAPAHILLNLAIGGAWAGRHGIADDKFPVALNVDHVRVYEKLN